ncbi:MAG: spondin domain-containing protein [Kofleriaceae bacterium]|nr:spondin domain-containing protein [Kofleriaceae bacterium]
MKLGALLISASALAACGDDDGTIDDIGVEVDEARDFQVRIENVAPWTVLKAGAQETQPDESYGFIERGEAFIIRFSGNTGHAVTFAAMFGESNDWFFAPGPDGIPLYVDGQPNTGDVTSYVRVWDAGTELDQEPGIGDATGTNQPQRNFGDADPDTTVRVVPQTVTLTDGSTFRLPGVPSMIRATLELGADQVFTLRIENVSSPTTLVTSRGTRQITMSPVAYAVHRGSAVMFEPGKPAPEGLEDLAEGGGAYPISNTLRYERGIATPLSAGVFVVHTEAAPLFTVGSADYGVGLEALAEDGNQVPLRDALAASPPAGVVATGELVTANGAAAPGEAFEVVVHAAPGDNLSFATMFGMSNDWFFATGPDGIALFNEEGSPRWGDVTSEVVLYDLGTEIDEELDVGPNTAPQQLEPNTGRADSTTTVRAVTVERYEPLEEQHIRVTVTPL